MSESSVRENKVFALWNFIIVLFMINVYSDRSIGILVCDPCDLPCTNGKIILFICKTVFGYTPLRSQPLKFVALVG